MNNPSAPPDPSFVQPSPVRTDPAFEEQRKRVAMALMAQRGIGPQHPWGQTANQALSIWNRNRRNPGLPSTQPTPMSETAISQVEANPLGY